MEYKVPEVQEVMTDEDLLGIANQYPSVNTKRPRKKRKETKKDEQSTEKEGASAKKKLKLEPQPEDTIEQTQMKEGEIFDPDQFFGDLKFLTEPQPSSMTLQIPMRKNTRPAKVSSGTKHKKTKADISAEQKETGTCMEALKNKLKFQVPSGWDRDCLKSKPNTDLECPIHNVNVDYKTSKNGWEYIKCLFPDCLLLAPQTDAIPYMRAVRNQLHPDMKGKMLCFCGLSMTLKMSRSERNPGRIYLRCSKKECNFFQWADTPKNRDPFEDIPLPSPTWEYADKTLLRHPSCDVAKPKTYFDDDGSYQGPEISMVDSTNEILYPPELRGLIYREANQPKGYYVSGPHFYDDGNYPGSIWMADDGKNTITNPPELKGLLYRETPEKAKKSNEKLKKWREEKQRREELKHQNMEPCVLHGIEF